MSISQAFRKLAWPVASAIVLATSLGACAYKAGRGDRAIPGGYKDIAVPVFKNKTHEVGAEVYFTNAMIREIERSRIGRVASQDQSQVTLEGVLSELRIAGGGESTDGFPAGTYLNTSYSITVWVNLRLRRNSDQKVIWETELSSVSSYSTPRIGVIGPAQNPSEALTSSNALYNHSARHISLRTMAETMMAELHDRMTENF